METKKSKTRREYELRVNRVVDYVDAHFEDPLSLETLAGVAPFSQYHFHRVFSVIMGETVNDYVKRIRLEKAAKRLIHEPDTSLTAIALESGFSSSSVFARSFKHHFGVSASSFKERNPFSEKPEIPNIKRPEMAHTEKEVDESLAKDVWVENIPPCHLAYVRRLGAYDAGIEEAFGRLFRWAGPRQLLTPGAVTMGITYDNPHVTEPEKCRFDACVTVSEDVSPSGDVSTKHFAPGLCARYHFEGPGQEIENAYHLLYDVWLTDSGYIPSDYPIFFILNLSNPDRAEQYVCDFCLPIAPL